MTGLLALSVASIGCGGGSSPTAPSPVATTAPAVATANVAGTWEASGTAFMTITQAGATISGTQLPITMDLGGITAVITGTVTGTVSGANVTLSLQDIVTVRRPGDTMTCRGADSFTGQVSGDTLSGVFISSTTRYVCDRGIPVPTPQVSAPMTFTRQ